MMNKYNLNSELLAVIFEYNSRYGKLNYNSGYRTYQEQLDLFLIGRKKEKLTFTENFFLGRRCENLSPTGAIKSGTVTNALPMCSAHNFGMCIDLDVSEDYLLVTKRFNILGKLLFNKSNMFENGVLYGDPLHIEMTEFKLPKPIFRWSLFCSSWGYDIIKLLGGLND